MKVIISKHVHSSNASWSSNDKTFRILTTIKAIGFTPEEGHFFENMKRKLSLLNGETVFDVYGDDKLMFVRLKANKQFQKGGIFSNGYSDTKEFKELIKSYENKGWGELYTNNCKELFDYNERSKRREEKIQKERGIVNWKYYEERTTADYQGGFSDDVFNSELLLNYIGDGRFVHGWIGDSETRRAEHDKTIEEGLRKRGLSPEQMYNWISSSDGRHFAESLCDFEILEEQIEEIEKNLNRIYNCCLIYGSPEHEGTYDSTLDIRERYEELGILLPEDNTAEYKAGSHFKMFAAALICDKASKGKAISKEEHEFMKEIKDNIEQQNFINEVKDVLKKK